MGHIDPTIRTKIRTKHGYISTSDNRERTLSGEERMMLAVLIQAIQDYALLKSYWIMPFKEHKQMLFLHEYFLREGFQEDHIYSFEAICKYFNLDIDEWRKKIEELDLDSMIANLDKIRHMNKIKRGEI